VAVLIRVLEFQARDDHRAILNVVFSVLDQSNFISLPPSMNNTVNNDTTEEEAEEEEEQEEQEEQTSEPEVCGRGQCKKIAAHHHLGPAWEEP
jgi:hypothetical protein